MTSVPLWLICSFMCSQVEDLCDQKGKETYLLERLAFNTVDHSIDDSRGADHELETLSAHVLNEHGKMELTTTAHCIEK